MNKKHDAIVRLLLDLQNKHVVWSKVDRPQKTIFLQRLKAEGVTIEEVDQVYAEMQGLGER